MNSCLVWGESDVPNSSPAWPCSFDKNYAEAETICQAQNARLCTEKELENECTQGSGCGFDAKLVWAQKILV